MARVAWSREALAKLDEIARYIRQFDPWAANRTEQQIRQAAARLADFPKRGRNWFGPYRELTTVRPYLIRYKIDGDDVTIVDIRHMAQD